MDKRHILEALSQLLEDEHVVDSGSGDAEQGERESADAVARTIAKIDGMLWILYPRGVKPAQYADLVRTVRVLDRLCQLQELSEASAGAISADSSEESTVDSGADSTAESTVESTVESGAGPAAEAAESAAPAPVDDDRTAPIVNEQIFAQAMQSQQAAWKALSEGTLRGPKSESDGQSAVGEYQSIFKLKPNR